MVTELLKKYIYLVQMFIRAGERGLTLAEISDKWEDHFGTDYSRRTFNNHREAVEEVFGIRILCRRADNTYYIKGTASDVMDENAENAWLINTFTVNNMLALSKERLSGRVSVEDIPSGRVHLTSIMEAMTAGFKICIDYQKYTSSSAERLTVHPYALKENEKRWYVVGWCRERGGMRVYALDRVVSLEILEEKFEMPADFDVDDLFATSFGIYLPEDKACTVRFRASSREAKYLRDLPLHHSQKEGASEEGWVNFEIFVCPNDALVMEFCRRGGRVEVLAPASLREAVAKELRQAALLYDGGFADSLDMTVGHC